MHKSTTNNSTSKYQFLTVRHTRFSLCYSHQLATELIDFFFPQCLQITSDFMPHHCTVLIVSMLICTLVLAQCLDVNRCPDYCIKLHKSAICGLTGYCILKILIDPLILHILQYCSADCEEYRDLSIWEAYNLGTRCHIMHFLNQMILSRSLSITPCICICTHNDWQIPITNCKGQTA